MYNFKSKKVWLNVLLIVSAYFIMGLYQKSCSSFVDEYRIMVVTLSNMISISLFGLLLYKYLIPSVLYKSKYIYFLILSVIAIYLNSFLTLKLHYLSYWLTGGLTPRIISMLNNDYYLMFDIYIILIVSYICLITYKMFIDQWEIQTQYQLLQKENAQTELNLLKAQINPHFLFNSINTIFASIDRNNNEARELILKFSEILRYQIYECNVNTISLEKEIKYIGNYVELQKLRKNTNVNIDFVCDIKEDFQIAPILFIPFIENAFKFVSNDTTSNNNFINITIITKNNKLHFTCINTIENIRSREIGEANGIGIINTERRLELLYNKKYKLNYGKENNEFIVNLEIELL